jgi:hypothetical protein
VLVLHQNPRLNGLASEAFDRILLCFAELSTQLEVLAKPAKTSTCSPDLLGKITQNQQLL